MLIIDVINQICFEKHMMADIDAIEEAMESAVQAMQAFARLMELGNDMDNVMLCGTTPIEYARRKEWRLCISEVLRGYRERNRAKHYRLRNLPHYKFCSAMTHREMLMLRRER